MPVSTSSGSSRSSRSKRSRAPSTGKPSPAAPWIIGLVLAALSAAAIAFFYSRGQILYYGDAAAHINIARRIIDSRTPGWLQIGTVWLPVPHLLMVPLVRYNSLWQSGLAGSIPSGICFVLAGVLVFLSARRMFAGTAAAAAACLIFALNPNLLYLQSVPMTESVFLACLAALLYCTVRYREEQSWRWVTCAGVVSTIGTLTRYEGWFLIPFLAAFFWVSSKNNRWKAALVFSAIAAIGPAYWLFHNAVFYGNVWEFYSGPSSAKAIYQRALDQGMARHPGDHDWTTAVRYLMAAIDSVAGTPLVWMAVGGAAACALLRRAWWALLFLILVPVFYVLSIHSGGTPVFVPYLWPHGYYNTRYALGTMPLLAFAAAGLVALTPQRYRLIAAVVVVLAAVAPWLAYPREESWICWKESQVNSDVRRQWTGDAAAFLRANYRRGDGILTTFGDMTAVYQQAGIPLRETLTECNEIWHATTQGKCPLNEKWAVAVSGDAVAQIAEKYRPGGPRYDLVKTIAYKGAPVIRIYRRHE